MSDPGDEMWGAEDWPPDEPFCIIHGYEHMKYQFGNPIPYCAECEKERDALPTGERPAQTEKQ